MINLIMVLLYDCTMYNGDEITPLRMKYLNPIVDKFFITESWWTQSQKKKAKLYFHENKSVFEPYMHKIVFIELHDLLGNTPDEEEWEQKKAALPFVEQVAAGADYVMAVCDADEIYDVKKTNVNDIFKHAGTNYVKIAQRMYYYNFDTFHPIPWCLAYFVPSRCIRENKSPHINLQDMRGRSSGMYISTGWHFSYFGNMESLQRKHRDICCVEFSGSQFTSTENIRAAIKNKSDHLHREEFQLMELPFDHPDNEFPEEFRVFYNYLCKEHKEKV